MRRKWTKRVDDIVLHQLAAYPLLGLVMFGIFRTAFGTLGQGMSNKLTAWLTTAAVWLGGMLEQIGVSSGLRGLVIDGMIVGVSSVLSFTPVIMLLFLCLSLLEDCGYMARAAFLMDKPLQAIGLTGRSFIPMLMGFGCSVPAVMAARSMHTDRDRRLTILLIPFISCGAKLPVYALLASAFFPDMADAAVSIVCLGGLLVGIGCGKVLSSTFLRSRGEPFIMELPPYRMPSMENVMRNIWRRLSDFLTRAFTVILLSSVLIWFLCTYNSRFQVAASLQSSILGEVAGVVTVFLRPLGFGSPEAASAVLTGLLAKESIISTLAVTLGTGTTGDELKLALRVLFPTDAAACSFLTFVMLYTPCVAAMTTIRRELGSLRETLLCAAGQMGLAWLCAYVIYHALM